MRSVAFVMLTGMVGISLLAPESPPVSAAPVCPTPPGTIDRPVIDGAYVPGKRSPLLTWTTTCPNRTDFRLEWSFLLSDGTFTGRMAWEGRGDSYQLPEPENQNAVAVAFGLYNRDLGGGAGFNSAQVPLQVIPPAAPGTPSLIDNGEGRVTVTWTAPQSDGGAQPAYTVTTTPTTSGCTTTETTCLLTGLTVDSTFDVVVQAANSAGSGPVSVQNSITPAGPRLLAPTRVVARVVGSTIRVSWRPPTGQQTTTPVRYVVTSKPGGLTCRTGVTSCTFRRLEPGTAASFTVTAVRGAKRTSSRPSPTVQIPLPPAPTAPAPTPTSDPTPKPPQELS